MTTITCLLCGKQLDPVVPNNQFYGEMGNDANVPNVQPYNGVIFAAHGNFGSAVHDPVERPEVLVAVICDECLITHRDRVHTTDENEDVGEDENPESWDEGVWPADVCPFCDGTGTIVVHVPMPGGCNEATLEEEQSCSDCCGTGYR